MADHQTATFGVESSRTRTSVITSLPEALIVVSHAESVEARPALPDLFLDFKKALALPTALLYQVAQEGTVERVAIVPPIYLHDLIHRFYNFLSRVAVPD